jgi:hypothetical protein
MSLVFINRKLELFPNQDGGILSYEIFIRMLDFSVFFLSGPGYDGVF